MKKNRTPFYMSVYFAIQGIVTSLKEERNLKIHTLIALCVVVAGFVFHISIVEWFVCLILFAIVISLEIVNTAIESTANLAKSSIKSISKEQDLLVKKAKDAAAGAVLVSAIVAVIIGIIIFVPKIIAYIQ